MHSRALALLPVVAVVVGCSTPARNYDVSLRNDLDKPVLIWLTKDGPPLESKWLPPEELSGGTDDTAIGGVVVPPGKTAGTGPVTGHFASGTRAVLRVYVGETTYNGVLAVSRGSPDRVDTPLPPGTSDLVVRAYAGRYVVAPAGAGKPPK